MVNVLYLRENPDRKRYLYDTPDALNCHDTVYFKDIVLVGKMLDRDLGFYAVGYEQSTPDKATVDRIYDNRYLLHYIVRGEGYWNGIPIAAGDTIITLPKQRHTIKSNKDNPMQYYWIDFYGRNAREYAAGMNFKAGETGQICRYNWLEKIEPVFRDMIYINHSDTDTMEYLTGCLLIIFAYHIKNSKNGGAADGLSRSEQSLMRATDYILSRAGVVKVEEIAAYLNITRRHLNRIFIRYKNISAQSYIFNIRMDAAAKRLADDGLMIKEIAMLAGYSDYAQFSKIFKKHYGIPPQEYRTLRSEV